MNASILPSVAPTDRTAPRLRFLDGLRGAMALFVLFHHAFFQITLDRHASPLSPVTARLFSFLNYGPTAVIVFIVLSGFCLMLPVANAPDGKPRGGWRQYFSRRAARILPPYWAALLFALTLIRLVPDLQRPLGRAWDTAVPALAPAPILTHVLLLHDFTAPYFVRIDPPMWSVALEWHIYFLFPLLLLVWRRSGMAAVVLAAMILGYLPHKLSHGVLDFAKFHYIGLFAVGMAACWIATSTEQRAARLRALPWGGITAFLALGCLFTVPRNFGSVSNFGLPDYVPALASASLLVYCTLCASRHNAKSAHLVDLLETPWLVGAGRFSYSLYLIHYPLLALAYAGLSRLDCSAESRLVLLGCGCCPLIVALASLFFRLFEKPFIEKKSQN